MDLRRDQTRAVEEILADLRADPERHLPVLHHLTNIWAAWSAFMISRSAARRLTWDAALHAGRRRLRRLRPLACILPLGRVALHRMTVGSE